ncbi:SDR family NAD(P)-dependent oxidoreductase [Nocardia aurea]|uniref:SDR family NAD(P)-dependent oxidoreductase n=1 Tax=Nocardia aurea TaxID=2144174 RepID=UPI000D68F6E1|nr:SDR family oxidoreductase [Nocardia aurea]
MDRLTGRVAIISGAGRGIGRAIALKLAAEGAGVVVNDLDPEPAEETVAAVKSVGGEAVACPGDVTELSFAHRFVRTAMDSFGGLDIIVNNAGYTWDAVIHKMTDEQWDAILDLHLKAPFRILRAALPYLKTHPVEYHRKVVNISSVAGLGGNPGQANYAAAKAGVAGLTKTLAKEWGRHRVNVNAVAFGLIATRLTETPADEGASITMYGKQIKIGIGAHLLEALKGSIPLGRAGTPEEAAGAVYLLCTPESDYISGQVVVCGGGFAL